MVRRGPGPLVVVEFATRGAGIRRESPLEGRWSIGRPNKLRGFTGAAELGASPRRAGNRASLRHV